MINKIMGLSQKLIVVPSTNNSKKELEQVLKIAEEQLEGYTLERFKKDNCPSILVYNAKTRPKKFKVILNAHLDVVPGKKTDYKAVEKKGKLYGRGTYDMKATAAAEILVFKEVAKQVRYPLALQLVTDEETGGFNGTKYQIEKGVRADFVIAGEPTDLGVNNKAKGIVWVKIRTHGKTAHGAYVWNGDNAIWSMKKVLNSLEKSYGVPKREVWRTTVNLAKIETSNTTFNKVPDDCTISLDIRCIPEDKNTVIQKIRSLLPKDVKLEVLLNEPAQFTDEKNPFLQALCRTAEKITNKKIPIIVKHGGSDIRHFNQVGCDGVTFGPIGAGHHSDNEYVEVRSLYDYYNIIKDFLVGVQRM